MPNNPRRIEAPIIVIPGYAPLFPIEDLFLGSLTDIEVSFLDGFPPFDVGEYGLGSVEAQAGGDIDLDFLGPNVIGGPPFDELFPELEAVSVQAGGMADVLFETFAGEDIAERLRTVNVQAHGDAILEFRDHQQQDIDEEGDGTIGDKYMRNLREIEVTSIHGRADLNISSSGSDQFMRNLETIRVTAKENISVEISASANAPGFPGDDFMKDLKSIEIMSDMGSAHLSLSHDGGEDFMQNLRTIYVEGGNGVDESGNGLDASVSISASANIDDPNDDPSQFGGFGENFMKDLKSITVIGNAGKASLSVSHSGGRNFMPDLKAIHVEARGIGNNDNTYRYSRAEVSISASVEPQLDPDMVGESFMKDLKSITILSELTGASLSVSHDGGARFMRSLETIHVESKATDTASGTGQLYYDAEISISNSANRWQATLSGELIVDFNLFNGDRFMESLKSITVLSARAKASASISNSGGADFMEDLKTIHIENKGLGAIDGTDDRAQLSISNSAPEYWRWDEDLQQNVLVPDSLLRGDNFMESLQTITVLSNAAGNASASISNSGGDDFMRDLETIRVINTGDLNNNPDAHSFDQPDAQVSISASLNYTGAESDHFMESLKTIQVVSDHYQASLTISVSGSDYFMESLETFEVRAKVAAHVSISHSIGTEIENNPASTATGMNFMQALHTVVVDSSMGIAEFSISNTAGDNFMASLTNVNVHGGQLGEIFFQNEDGHHFVPNLREIELLGANGSQFMFDEDSTSHFHRDQIRLDNSNWDYDNDLTLPAGDHYMHMLETVSLSSGIGGRVQLRNGFDDDGELHGGGNHFLSNLGSVLVETGLDADASLNTRASNAFEGLANITLNGGNNPNRGAMITHAQDFQDTEGRFQDEDIESLYVSELNVQASDGVVDAFTSLSSIRVLSHGAITGSPNDIGSIEVFLRNIGSDDFDAQLSTDEGGDIEFIAENTPGLMMVTARGEDEGRFDFLGDQSGLELIDLTAMAAGSSSEVNMHDPGATFTDGVETWFAKGDFEYRAAAGASERLVFTDDQNGMTTVFGFDTGPAGDILDFSALGVANIGELIFTPSGGDLLITSNDGDFDGTVQVVGITNSALLADNIAFSGP